MLTLMTCSLAVALIGAAPRPHKSLEDKFPDLKSARQAARDSLGRPECLAILADFKDGSGQRLDEVLGATRRTAQEQLDLLVFESGLGRYGCARSVVNAFTHVDSPVVWVCLKQFRAAGPRAQQAVLIHEMLHSLGLGENPPESAAITVKVMKRCGR